MINDTAVMKIRQAMEKKEQTKYYAIYSLWINGYVGATTDIQHCVEVDGIENHLFVEITECEFENWLDIELNPEFLADLNSRDKFKPVVVYKLQKVEHEEDN